MAAPQSTDICIVGAGMVGLTTACLAAKAGFSVTLLDAAERPAERLTADSDYRPRVSAINAASAALFKQLGAWPAIKNTRASAYTRMQVWATASQSWSASAENSIEFDAASLGADQLGYIIENDLICQALSEQLDCFDQATRLNQTRLESLKADDNTIQLVTTQGQSSHPQIACKLLIGADGQHSRVRQLSRISTEHSDFAQRAIVARIQTDQPHRQTALQRFLPSGPLGVLPLADGSASIVWSVDIPEAEKLLALDDDDFATRLAEALEQRLGNVRLLSPRFSFDLAHRHAQRYIDHRVALVGDAAHRTHPLAGLGANIGFADAATLINILQSARSRKRDIGLQHTLRKYERQQRAQNTLVLNAMQAFKSAFSQEPSGIHALPGLGLAIADRLPPLKHALMRRAMGL